jgi:arylsulfatase A-like enzyme
MSSQRPNILVFLTDDHGRWTLPCYGNRETVTPTLDWLARTGTRMDRAFTPGPVCSPARASFWTGRIPSGHGVHDWIHEPDEGGHPGIRGQNTLAQRLHHAGYQTALCGKWHCGHFTEQQPGFDTWFTLANGTNARFGNQPFIEGNGTRVEHHGHQATFITDRALRFLGESDRDRPFFLFVGYTDTHTPHAGSPERLVSRYRGASFSDIPREEPSPAHGQVRLALHPDPAKRHESLAQYYASVSMIDEQVGRILDELDSRGQLDNTLVVYTSDHGHMNGHHGLHTKGNATIPQNLLDESILVPCLLRWPGRIADGSARNEMVDHCDLWATLLDAAGCDADAAARADRSPGRSYLPLLTGHDLAWRDAQCCEYGNARMIRTDNAKLIRRYAGPNGRFADEFYDLSADPRERVNRMGDPAAADRIAALSARLEAHFASYELPEHAGCDIATQPTCNPWEPWTRDPRTTPLTHQ